MPPAVKRRAPGYANPLHQPAEANGEPLRSHGPARPAGKAQERLASVIATESKRLLEDTNLLPLEQIGNHLRHRDGAYGRRGLGMLTQHRPVFELHNGTPDLDLTGIKIAGVKGEAQHLAAP